MIVSLTSLALALSTPAIVRRASWDDAWPAAELLRAEFGGLALARLQQLQVPSFSANVFFRVAQDSPEIGVATSGDKMVGVAQLLLADLQPPAGSAGAGRRVGFVQSVCVAPDARRRGIASELVRWCELRCSEAWPDVGEIWLAVAEENDAAAALYAKLGYLPVYESPSVGNWLLRKPMAFAGAAVPRSAGARMALDDADAPPPPPPPPPPEGGLGLAPLAANLGVQCLYVAVASLGVAAMLGPFGGPPLPALLGLSHTTAWLGDGGTPWVVAPAGEALLGLSVAAAELWRIGVRPEDALPSAGGGGRALEYTPAQAVQMRPLYEIAGGESGAAAALAAVGAWQLAIALAEEVYYRGFLQSAGRLALTALPPGLPATVLEGLPLAVAAAVFGLVHTEFVDAVDGDGDDSKLRWFAITGAYGAVYGLLFAVTGHRLIAPVAAHGGLNLGLCARDWRRMRESSQEELERIFGESI